MRMTRYNNLSVTNGKEALEKIKYLTLNEPSGYGVYSTQLKDTMYYFIIKKELDELSKYKRAFEILKDKGIFEFKDYTNMIFLKPEDYIWNGDIIEEMFINVNDEEYELLEEVINNE